MVKTTNCFSQLFEVGYMYFTPPFISSFVASILILKIKEIIKKLGNNNLKANI